MFGKNNVSSVAPLNRSQINKDVRIRGLIGVSEPIVLAGQLDGAIKADTTHSVSTAIIAGEAAAQSVTIDSKVLGSFVANKVYVSVTEYFEGQLHCQNFATDGDACVDAKFIKVPVTNG